MPSTSDFDHPPPRTRWSLRAKALAATLALVAYLIGAGLYVAAERAEIYSSMLALDELARHERQLASLENAIDAAVSDLRAAPAESPDPTLSTDIAQYLESGSRQFAALEEFDASYPLLMRAVQRSWRTLQEAPVEANWSHLRETLMRVRDDLEIRHSRLSELRESVQRAYHRQYDAVTVESLLLAMLGVVVFGSIGAWFMASLATDIRQLEHHARQVVRGARGVKLAVRRRDELGRLMHAVNRMAEDLDEREKRIELEAQRRSHQDKMLAVGALAAGVAHEVNNPLAVISGIAQEWRQPGAAPSPSELAEGAHLILASIQRASQATRHLAEAATPEMSELDWVDVNAIVRRVVQLMGYDKRYRRMAFESRLDPALPAVRTSGNAIQQVLMQMLSLGCDALAAQPAVPARVFIRTRVGDEGIEAWIDFPPVLDFGRGEVQRTLLLARAGIEPLRGRLAFGQAEDQALRIKLLLPVDVGGGEG